MKQLGLPVYNLETLPISQYPHIPAQPPGARTSVSGRSCVCTGLSRRHPSHTARSPGPPHLPHHQFHFYWLQPQNTAAPLDTKKPERQALFATVTLESRTSTCGSRWPLSKSFQSSGELCTAASLPFYFCFLLPLLFPPVLRIEPRASSMLGCSVSAQPLCHLLSPLFGFPAATSQVAGTADSLYPSEVFNFIFPVLQTHEFEETIDYT